LTVENVRHGLADYNRVLVSLDAMMESNENGKGSIYDYLQDENQVDPSEGLEKESLIQEMTDALQDLSERERLILSLYYNDELTFKEIGKVLDITESRVCQLHARAILNLKEIMTNEQ